MCAAVLTGGQCIVDKQYSLKRHWLRATTACLTQTAALHAASSLLLLLFDVVVADDVVGLSCR